VNLNHVISELRRELEALDEAISLLEGLTKSSKLGSRRPFSAATRKKMAAAQKKRWAAYRKGKKKPAKP